MLKYALAALSFCDVLFHSRRIIYCREVNRMRLNEIVPLEKWNGESRALWHGQREVIIEGHRGLFSYETHCIRVRCREGLWTVTGEGLHIDHFGPEDLLIRGLVRTVTLDGETA